MSPIRQEYCTLPLAFKTTKFARNLFFDCDYKISIADLRVTAKIWSDKQCSPSLAGLIKSASICWDICKKTTGCTAVNFSLDTGDCVLRHCANPVPAPEWSFSPYIGISALPSGKKFKLFHCPIKFTIQFLKKFLCPPNFFEDLDLLYTAQ